MTTPSPYEYDSAPQPATPTKTSHPLRWILGGIALIALICAGGSFAAALVGNTSKPKVHVVTAAPQPTRITATSDSPELEPTTVANPGDPHKVTGKIEFGDNTLKVGRDIPAGTYRLTAKVSAADACYWAKASDPEITDYLGSGFAETGRLEVVLKKGQYFRTEDCGTWRQQ